MPVAVTLHLTVSFDSAQSRGGDSPELRRSSISATGVLPLMIAHETVLMFG